MGGWAILWTLDALAVGDWVQTLPNVRTGRRVTEVDLGLNTQESLYKPKCYPHLFELLSTRTGVEYLGGLTEKSVTFLVCGRPLTLNCLSSE